MKCQQFFSLGSKTTAFGYTSSPTLICAGLSTLRHDGPTMEPTMLFICLTLLPNRYPTTMKPILFLLCPQSVLPPGLATTGIHSVLGLIVLYRCEELVVNVMCVLSFGRGVSTYAISRIAGLIF
jgi:hypothetical protein